MSYENLYRYDIQPVHVGNLFTSLDKAFEKLNTLMPGCSEGAYKDEITILVSGFMNNLDKLIGKHYRSSLDNEADEVRYPLDETQFEIEMLMHLFPNMFEHMSGAFYDSIL